MKTKIQAKPQTLRGDDGHDTFSIRIKHSLTVKLNEMANVSGRSEIISSAESWRMVWRTR